MKAKIVVDLFNLNAGYTGGVSRFSIGLVDGLIRASASHNIEIIASNENYDFIKTQFNDIKIITVNKSKVTDFIYKVLSLICWTFRKPKLLKVKKILEPTWLADQLRGCKVIVPTSVINFYSLPCDILCIHDIQHEVIKKNFKLKEKIYRWAGYRLSAEESKLIQISSSMIGENLLEHFGGKLSKKLLKIHEGYSKNIFNISLPSKKPKELSNSKEKFIYYPANLWKHKNHKIVIGGLAAFNARTNLDYSLVLTGDDYGMLNEITNFSENKGIRLHYLKIVKEIEMRWLYKESICVVAAGNHESSSLPIREALACGGRVIAADIEPNLEILGLRGYSIFEKNSIESFASELEKLVFQLTSKSKVNETKIENFEWEMQGKKYLHAINS